MAGAPSSPSTDWRAWHDAYEDPGSELSRRLGAVRQQIVRWLDGPRPARPHVVSVCAGDGRDLIGALDGRADAAAVAATLVELDPELAAAARVAAPSFRVVAGDAGAAATYAGVPRADLLLLCGVLGNVTDAVARGTIAALPMLCARGARVIWTRTRRAPDLTPSIRAWFAASGFEERAFVTGGGEWSVGAADLRAEPLALDPGATLFTFVR